jgi:predicted Zn-dependent protease
MKLSRGKEDAADERGSMLAVQAGYAPDGLMNFLITLQDSGNSPKATKAFGQLRSHAPAARRTYCQAARLGRESSPKRE